MAAPVAFENDTAAAWVKRRLMLRCGRDVHLLRDISRDSLLCPSVVVQFHEYVVALLESACNLTMCGRAYL